MENISSRVMVKRLMWVALPMAVLLLLFSSIIHKQTGMISCDAPTSMTLQHHNHELQQELGACEASERPDRKAKKMKKLWARRSWKDKVDSMSALFRDLLEAGVLSQHSKALCISAGIGQEVMALRHMGMEDAIGIEVVESPPLVVRGDAHHHPFPNNTFDLEFSAHLWDALFPSLFISEMERTLRPGGVAVILIPSPPSLDDDQITPLFNSSQLVSTKSITLSGLPLSMQMLFKKNF